MNEQLETDLRRVLAGKAARVPSEAISRVTNTDYHPRVGWLNPRRTAGAFAGAGVVGAMVATVVLLLGATPALAGWTAVPERGHHVPSAVAQESCQARLSALPTAPSGRWSPIVTDVRGPYTLAVFRDRGVFGTCMTGPSVTEASVSGVGGSATSIGSANAKGSGYRGSTTTLGRNRGSKGIERSVQSQLDSTSSGPYTIMEGQVARGVTGVAVVLEDGTDVETTVGGGWFVAWWPNDEQAVSARVATPGGTRTVPLVHR